MLRWIQREEPAAYAQAAVVGHPSTFLLHRLTGRFAIDHAAAQTTGLFAYRGEPRWLPEAAEAMDVALEKLPEPVDAVAAAGTLTATAATALGLEPELPVSAGANDSSCAAFALAILEPGRLGFLLGTTNAVVTAVDGPRFGPEFVMRRSIVPGQWLAVGATATGGASMDWLLRLLDIATGDPAEMDGLVGDRRIERDSPFFLPHLAGERSPLWDPAARGTLHGLNLATDRRALLLAGIEGNAFALREVLEAMRDRFGQPANEALVTGSQARGVRFMQALADVTKLRLRVAEMADAAPLGAALLGRVAAGECAVEDLRAATVPVATVVEPTAGAGASYDERFARYREIYEVLHSDFTLRQVTDGQSRCIHSLPLEAVGGVGWDVVHVHV
ncbi:MAG: FGGY-family carbohydrate kinase [Chloroflexota bacterium]|nr:FGGY-family carbohydrate kinase [Chloroflexota bacterium]MDP6509319.1 FGGY-family carbohydrate kinase [Chloroflexota bacterium]MDP6758686.1 FGGY-family carbohydrate kinase [Chloroflexota bacterium]